MGYWSLKIIGKRVEISAINLYIYKKIGNR